MISADEIRINAIKVSIAELKLTSDEITKILGVTPRKGGRPPKDNNPTIMVIFRRLLEGTRLICGIFIKFIC